MHNAKLFLDLNNTGKPYKLIIENNYLNTIIEELTEKKVLRIEAKKKVSRKYTLTKMMQYNLTQIIKKLLQTFYQKQNDF